MTGRQRTRASGGRRIRCLVAVAAAMLAPIGVGAAAGELPRQDLPESVLSSLRTALGAYEEVRGELAADRLEGVPEGASRLAAALRSALDGGVGLAEPIPNVIEEAARIADSMAEARDLAAARSAFGEVSRRVLRLAGSEPRLAEGWHAFACPMADGFEKWLQPSAELDNPYMGTAMLRCGSATDWSVPEPAAAEPALASAGDGREPGAQEASAAGPIFRPGIPGLKMVDVRDHKFLWREIDELQVWERGDRLTVAEYRSKVIEKTAQFLELDGPAADGFSAVASEAVATLREAFLERPDGGGETSGVEGQFSSELEAAAARVGSFLQEEPRHQLFAPESKKWLLRLTFGPRETKEAREAEQARASPAEPR